MTNRPRRRSSEDYRRPALALDLDPATAAGPSPAPTLPAEPPLTREATIAADIEALLALRPTTGWTPLERREVEALAARMAERRDLNAYLDANGLTFTGRDGREITRPQVAHRKAAELAINRARAALGLNTSVGEARRQGRAQAAAGDQYGRRADDSWSPLLAYALDCGELLARPENHDYATEQALYERLCQAGEIEIDGTPKRGGVLWLDQIKAGMKVDPTEA